MSYNPDKSLSAFSYGKAGWFDKANQGTTTVATPVPVPGSVLLLLIGGLAARRFLGLIKAPAARDELVTV